MSELTESQLRALTPDERDILHWLAFYSDEGAGPVEAYVLATICGLGPRGMGARLKSLEDAGYMRRHVVRKATSRSDATYDWEITRRGREVLTDA